MTEKIMLIDGNSIINRAFYGVPLLTNAQGQYTNAVYGFLNILFKLIDEEKPEYLAVAFDLPAPTFRHKTFDGYKGTRKGMPEELAMQMPLLKEVLAKMNIKMYSQEGYEADDILGTLSALAQKAKIFPVVVSGDRDMLQIADDNLKIRIPKTKGGRTETEDYFKADVIEKYGVTPEEFIDVKALMGDASDNIPGVPGIGEKTATKIIQEYHDIENAIAHASEVKPKKASENLAEFQEQARLSKFLATIIRDMPLALEKDEVKANQIFNQEAYEWIKRQGFKTMFSRFETAQTSESAEKMDCTIITNDEDCKKIFATLDSGKVAYSLFMDEGVFCGMAIYSEAQGGVWIEAGEGLTEDDIFTLSKPFFMDSKFEKVGHDIKKDIHLLRQRLGEIIEISFDTAIGAYILNPTASSYDFDSIAQDYLNELFPSVEEKLGKGRTKKAFSTLSAEERSAFAVGQARVIFAGSKIMHEQLKANEQESLYFDIELPLVYVLADMESHGIKVDKEALIAFQEQLEISIAEITKEIFALSGEEFNLNSPKQLGVILFEKMGIKGGKKTKTGYSTAADVLEKLRVEYPIVDKILYYRQLAKLKSTYADGLLAVMDEKTEKIYSTFNQTITATGRISSTEPNLQNIPIRLELGRQLRKAFIPESDEFCFFDADYSQIELRILAHISGDDTLIYAFNNDQDIHKLTASQVFHVPFDEVTATQRSNAKAVNFGIVYGIGAFSLSQDLGITRKEAEAYIAAYFAKYPKIKTYLNSTIEQATADGFVSTLWNRRRAMPELQSNNFIQRSFGERVAMNMPIQGSAADIIKIAMVKVHRALKEKGLRSRLILQVHDELLIETHVDEKAEVAQILKDNMEQAAKLSVPLDVDVHEGNSWYEAK